jgi:NAD(P)-dependent dehydrogenase (short-subunit alcohol dehydrogenase family)
VGIAPAPRIERKRECQSSVYDTNVFGVIAVTQAMLPLLRESPAGRIVNMGSSVGSLTPNAAPDAPYRSIVGAAYSPSKTALSATTLAFAIELEKTNIKVNVVCPGFVATDLNDFRRTAHSRAGCKASSKDGADRSRRPHRHLYRRRRNRALVMPL